MKKSFFLFVDILKLFCNLGRHIRPQKKSKEFWCFRNTLKKKKKKAWKNPQKYEKIGSFFGGGCSRNYLSIWKKYVVYSVFFFFFFKFDVLKIRKWIFFRKIFQKYEKKFCWQFYNYSIIWKKMVYPISKEKKRALMFRKYENENCFCKFCKKTKKNRFFFLLIILKWFSNLKKTVYPILKENGSFDGLEIRRK